MSKSVELLSGTEDDEACEQSRKEDRSRLNLNGNRQLSRSATELRATNEDPTSRPQSSTEHRRSHHQPHKHVASVAQRTHTFFATLKSRWVRGRSKERKKSKESGANQDSPHRSGGLESDYAADYSSEHSRSSSATQSPARVALNHAGSPLARGNRDKSVVEDSPGRSSDVSSQKGINSRFRDPEGNDDAGGPSTASDTGLIHQDDNSRRRELALRQHAFFQLRLHIRRGANLVAMDRCGASDPYVKIKCSGRLLHKSRTVHRELNPVWDESVTLPIEDPFQSLNIKVFDYDWGLQDDFMGAALLDLTQLELGQPQDIILELKDPARPRQHLGEIYLTATLWPRNQQEKEQKKTPLSFCSLIVMKCQEDSESTEPTKNIDVIDKSSSSSECVKPDSSHPSHEHSPSITIPKKCDEVKYEKSTDPADKDEPKIQFLKTGVKVHERAKLSRTRNFARKDYSYSARGAARRKCKSVSALRVSLEKRVGSVERLLEDRVERIIEDNTEKHPWLQPIETWITERKCRNSVKKKANGDGEEGKDGEIEGGGEKKCENSLKKRAIVWEKCKNGESEGEAGENEECEVEMTKNNELGGADEISHLQGVKEEFPEPEEFGKEKARTSSSSEEQGEWLRHAVKSGCQELVDKVKDGFKEKVEDITRYFQRTNRLADVNRRLKSQIWSSVVTIVLVEAKNLIPMDIDGLSDPYVKFRLGTEKYKSKVVNKTVNPVWLEQFDLHLYEDPYLGQELEVTVWDRDKGHQDDLMGRTMIDLAGLEREMTHRIWKDLEDGAGSIFLLLTISGTTASETISDLAAQEDNPKDRERMLLKYSMWNSLQRPRDVGHLTVKVYRAQGLAAADLGGKSDPFCVLELVNSRLQTQTEYKTLAPNWQKIFTFNVKDINSVLEVTVYDEDRDHKVEFLGKIAIPLLRIRNGEKRWYSLKDKKLRGRAKGNFPQILLEMTVIWNPVRACARTLNPKEKKYMEPEVKFKRQLFLRNVLRLKAIIMFFIDLGKYIQSCWEWESKPRSIVAFTLFVLGCYYFEPWMFPAAALLIMLKYCIVSILTTPTSSFSFQSSTTYHDPDVNSDDCPPTPGDDDEDEDDKDKEEKKSLKERLQAIQEVTQTVQNSIGYIASLCERVKNLFNFTVPYLSYLAMVLAVLGAVVLYLIPVRYLILFWGVNKFFRKLLRPHSVPNNEVLDLISRVPDDEDLHSYRELKPMPTADCERGGLSTSPSSTSGRREQRKKHKGA